MERNKVTLYSDIDRELYQLFIQEALELLESIEKNLLDLNRDRNPAKIQELIRAAHTIKGGAAQIELNNVKILANLLETSFRCLTKKNIQIDRDLVNLLIRGYEYLRLSFFSQIENSDSQLDLDPNEILSEAESVFSQLEARLGQNPTFNDEAIFKINQVEAEVKLVIVRKEIGEALESIENVLANSKEEFLLQELQTQITIFLDLGAMLDLSEFVSIAQTTLATLEASPQAARNIGQLALISFRAARNSLLAGENLEANKPIAAVNDEQDSSDLNLNLEPSDRFESDLDKLELDSNHLKEIWHDLIALPESNDLVIEEQNISAQQERSNQLPSVTVDRELKLDISKLFVWQDGCNIFTIPYDRIEKNLSSKFAEILDSKGEKFLRWQKQGNSQLLKIHVLSELLNYQYPQPNLERLSQKKNQRISILIINLNGVFFALEISIEQIITGSQLIIKPFIPACQPPNYIYGCTILKDNLPAPTIDLNILLDLSLDRAYNNTVITKQERFPTILIVDDSATWLQILYNTLEKEGFNLIKARDGREGIDRLRENPEIQLVISDLEMPHLNGFEFLAFCRQELSLTKLPFILLTTRNTMPDRNLADRLGATAYFIKPYNKSEFIAAIKAIVYNR